MTSGPQRLRRGTLSEDAVLDAGMRLLERDGVEGLTMRSLATDLGAAPTAVYRYFRTKDDLLAALTDRLVARLVPAPAEHGWAAQVEHLALALREVLLQVPGAVGLLARSPFSPTSVRLVESVLAPLVAAGLDGELAVDAVQATVTYALGSAAQHVEGDAGFWAGVVDAARPGRDHPAIQATQAAWERSADEHFRAGVALLVAGLAARHAATPDA